jgi:hypothetical protein
MFELHVKPDAKVKQGDFGRQAHLKAVQRMWTLTGKTKGIEQLVVGRLNDLTQPSQPATPSLGPVHLTALMRRTDDLGPTLLVPEVMHLLARKAFIGHIDALRSRDDTGQRGRRIASHGEKGLSQRVVVATRCG